MGLAQDKEIEELFACAGRDRCRQASVQRVSAMPLLDGATTGYDGREGEDSMAISIRKLALEEAQRAFPRRGQQDLSEYVAALREIRPGEAASIDRQGLSDRAIKRRLGQAATSLGYRSKWSRQSSPEGLYFQVVGTPPTKATNGRRRGCSGGRTGCATGEAWSPKPGGVEAPFEARKLGTHHWFGSSPREPESQVAD